MYAYRACCVFVLVSILMIDNTQSCHCVLRHPQQCYCDSDFVIVAHVGNTNNHSKISVNDSYTQYPIVVEKIFKSSERFKQCDKQFVFTPSNPGDCGVKLCRHKKYILTGHVRGGQMWIDSCDWVQDFHKVTRREKRGLRNYYKHSCGCKIKRCSGHHCGKLSTNECGMFTLVWSCYTKYGVCMRRKIGRFAGKCMWKPNWIFHQCMEEHFYHHSKWKNRMRTFSVVRVRKKHQSHK